MKDLQIITGQRNGFKINTVCLGCFYILRNNLKGSHPVCSFGADLLPASEGEAITLAFLQDVMDILLQYMVKNFDRSTKVIDFHYPNELLQEYNWELADQPQTLEEILLTCRTALKYAIKTGMPGSANRHQHRTGFFSLLLIMLGAAAFSCWAFKGKSCNFWAGRGKRGSGINSIPPRLVGRTQDSGGQ